MNTYEQPVLPIARGDWVAEVRDGMINFGHVTDAYWDQEPGGAVLMDIVIYATSGEKIGRHSLAMGGPTRKEPAVPFDDTWTRCKKPNFPLVMKWVDTGRGTRTPSFQESYTRRPVRTKAVERRVKAAPAAPTAAPNFDPELEARALRIAAESLRDIARTLNGAAADSLREQAVAKESEANRLAPRR